MPVPLAVAAVAAIEAHGTAAVSAAAGSVGALTALLLSRSKGRVKPDIDGAALLAALGDGVDARIRALSSDPAVTTASQINEVVAILKAHFADDGRQTQGWSGRDDKRRTFFCAYGDKRMQALRRTRPFSSPATTAALEQLSEMRDFVIRHEILLGGATPKVAKDNRKQ